MALPVIPILATALGVSNFAAGLWSSKKNREAASDLNNRSESFTREMYNQQRNDALTDRDYANEYNSPEQQMQRYREAGLNPNLIYGNATNNASSVVRSSSGNSPNYTVPRYENVVGQAMASMVGLLQNLSSANKSYADAEKNKSLKNLLDIDTNYRDSYHHVNLTKLGHQADVLGHQSDYLNTVKGMRVDLIAQQLANSQKDYNIKSQMLQNLKNTGDLQKLDLYLKSNGLDGNDPYYIKSILKFLITGSLSDAINP